MRVEILRTILIIGGLFTIGFNIAIFRHLPQLVVPVTPWRIYVLGQCFFDLAAIYGVRHRFHEPIGWTAIFVAIGIALTLFSLVLLNHSHRRKLP